MVLAFGAILDPTKKLNFLRYTYSRLDSSIHEEKLEGVIEIKVHQLTWLLFLLM